MPPALNWASLASRHYSDWTAIGVVFSFPIPFCYVLLVCTGFAVTVPHLRFNCEEMAKSVAIIWRYCLEYLVTFSCSEKVVWLDDILNMKKCIVFYVIWLSIFYRKCWTTLSISFILTTTLSLSSFLGLIPVLPLAQMALTSNLKLTFAGVCGF